MRVYLGQHQPSIQFKNKKSGRGNLISDFEKIDDSFNDNYVANNAITFYIVNLYSFTRILVVFINFIIIIACVRCYCIQ